MTNLEKLNNIFCEVFDAEESALNSNFDNKSIDGWDSVHQLSLTSAVEDEFDIMLDAEDILEFTILASSNIVISAYDIANPGGTSYATKQISNAWRAKCEQAYQKAKLSFGDSPQFVEVQNIYLKTEDKIKKMEKKIGVHIKRFFKLLFGIPLAIIIILLVLLIINRKVNGDSNNQNRINYLYSIDNRAEQNATDIVIDKTRNRSYIIEEGSESSIQ